MAGRIDGLGRWVRHSPAARLVASHLGALYIRLVLRTTRWQVIGQENLDGLLVPGTGFIAALWHGRLFVAPTLAPKGRRTVAMISNNRDGDLISAIVRRFGVFTVRGSTYDHAKGRDKGGSEAYSGAHRELTGENAVVAITPDGPRGPRMRAQRGAAMLAIATGVPILPVAFSTVRGRTLRNWDRFVLPAPFGRGVKIYGKPIHPPASDDEVAIETLTREIEEVLCRITDRADDICGRARVGQGPPVARP